MSAGATPANVEGLYEQLACQRAGQARALLARQVSGERLFTESAAALEEAAGVLLHAATAFIAMEGPLPGLFAETAGALEDAAGALLHAATAFISIDGPLPGMLADQAGALLAVAARFEEAADLSRTRDRGEGETGR